MNNKKDISWRGIVIGLLIFLGIVYVFSFDNLSFGGYFRFTLAMALVVVYGGALMAFLFGLLPGIFNFVCKHTEKFFGKNISFVVGGISVILTFLLFVGIVVFLDENTYFDKIIWILDNYLSK